jgi:hypothetical protein
MTRRFLLSLFTLSLLWLASAAGVYAQTSEQSAVRKVDLSQAEIDRIVQAFSAKEAQYREALNQYGFKREVTIQTMGFGGQVSGEYRRDSNFIFTENGRRYEKILFAPLSTLKDVTLTAEDLEDLNGVNQFALEAAKINQYNFTYLGKEKIDELDLYVFDVAPKVLPDPKKSKERFFQGRIWVDDQDLQIVKSKGKGVPETRDNRYPVAEIWRENIDGKYWFPTYTYANDDLFFERSGTTVRLKMKIKFSEYKQATSTVRILEDETEVIEEKPQTPPTNKKP